MAGAMGRNEVVDAIHVGFSNAVKEYIGWTGGGTKRRHLVESVTTVYAAREIKARADALGARNWITLEQVFGELVEWADAAPGRGRPAKELSELKKKSTGRVDIVLWNSNSLPRSLIEVKTGLDAKLLTDAKRILDWIYFFGRNFGGSIRYGVVATTFRFDVNRPDRSKSSCDAIGRAMKELAGEYGMAVKADLRPMPIDGFNVGSATFLISR